MNLENIYFGDVCQITNKETEVEYQFIKNTVLCKIGTIDTKYMDLTSPTLEKYDGKYISLDKEGREYLYSDKEVEVGDKFVNQATLVPAYPKQKGQEISRRKVLKRFNDYKNNINNNQD